MEKHWRKIYPINHARDEHNFFHDRIYQDIFSASKCESLYKTNSLVRLDIECVSRELLKKKPQSFFTRTVQSFGYACETAPVLIDNPLASVWVLGLSGERLLRLPRAETRLRENRAGRSCADHLKARSSSHRVSEHPFPPFSPLPLL